MADSVNRPGTAASEAETVALGAVEPSSESTAGSGDVADIADIADEVVDELLPNGFEWRRIVRTYPLTCLAVAVVGGFLLGRRRGPVIVSAVSEYATDYVTQGLEGFLDLGGKGGGEPR